MPKCEMCGTEYPEGEEHTCETSKSESETQESTTEGQEEKTE